MCPKDVPALWTRDAYVLASLDGVCRCWCFWSASCKCERGHHQFVDIYSPYLKAPILGLKICFEWF